MDIKPKYCVGELLLYGGAVMLVIGFDFTTYCEPVYVVLETWSETDAIICDVTEYYIKNFDVVTMKTNT